MSFDGCSDVNRLLAAARREGLDAAQAAHAGVCPDCAAALAAEEALRALAAAPSARRLPPAEVVLLRARLRARREAAERSLRPLVLWQRCAGAVAAAGLAAGLALGAPALATIGAPEPPTPARMVAGVGLLLLAALAARTRFPRDLSAG